MCERSGVVLRAEAFACANARGVEPGAEAEGEAFACANARGVEPGAEAQASAFETALGRLGLGARERRRLLEEVLRREGELAWSTGERLWAALLLV